MGFNGSTPLFCMSTETFADMANATVLGYYYMPPHPLEAEAGHRPPEDVVGPSVTVERHWQTLPRC